MARSNAFVASALPPSVVLVSSYVLILLVSHGFILIRLRWFSDGLPQGPSVLRQVWLDLHLPAWHQASRCVNHALRMLLCSIVVFPPNE